MKCALFWIVAVLLTEAHCQKFSQVVTTDKGAVRGKILETALHSIPVSAFLGIPYAKPPVGDLRFRDPIEADPWTGVLNTTDTVAICTQYLAIGPKGKEDCLYLDVYTPVLDLKNVKTLKPVMVWIYGGAYAQGFTSRELYGPDFFLEDDVVFVNMNYRLGPLGFLALGHPDARGNQGLKDQNLALQWVQKNIAKFGGDPNRVTIFGESAGGVSVTYHLFSPKSKGLFHQAIAQSGSSLCPWAYHTPQQSLRNAFDLGKRIGIQALTKEQLLHSLKKADVSDIVSAVVGMFNVELPLPINLPFTPTIEEIPSDPAPEQTFLDDCPISKFESGNYTHVPTMLGYNKDEGILFTVGLEVVREATLAGLSNLFVLDPTGATRGFSNLINKVQRGSISELIKVTTIYYFSGAIDATQRYLAKHNGDKPVYYYRLSYATEDNLHRLYNPQINGTAHIDDISLLFYMGAVTPTDPTNPSNVYRSKMVSLWTNFAKFGNPTPNNEPINGAVWKPSGKEGLQLDMGNEEFKMHGRLLDEVALDFTSLYTKVLPHVSACVKNGWNPLGLL